MTKSSQLPPPGERRTTIVVWEVDDPTKSGDPRYWWSEQEVARLREVWPDAADLTGRPKGYSLASLRKQAVDGAVEWAFGRSDEPEEDRVRLSLAPWHGADPERTYLIVAHRRAATVEERALSRVQPWPPAIEALRQEWLSALAAEDAERAGELKGRLDAAFREQGFLKPRETSPWDPARAVEAQPGVFVQDERPQSRRPC
jgi:hypothetical protein